MSNNKNVWLVSTDRPSRLSLLKSGKLNFGAEIISFSNSIPQHLYITSDEEIKKGDWCIYKTGEIIQYLVKLNTDNLKKITITTDQDLIYDGVQTIDDKFLEWFAKNPSCVRVEVEKEMYVPQINGKISDGKITHELSLDPSQNTLPYYKIIIKEMKNKQTAVEWLLEKLEGDLLIGLKEYNLVIKQAKEMEKEQVKRMYTEEEVYDLLVEWNMYQKGEPRVDEDEIPNGYMSFNEWFTRNI